MSSEPKMSGGTWWAAADGRLRVIGVRARNPGPFTGEGTNTYVVAGAQNSPAAVIDPGPDDAAHLAAILAAAGGSQRIAAILVTHAHLDHSAGAQALASATGALIYAFGRFGEGARPAFASLLSRWDGAEFGGGEGADRAFTPDRRLADGQSLGAPGAAWRLTAIRTPGHTHDHLAFALSTVEGAPTGVVFSGDHVMGWATSLVSPPDGDMTAYMASLERLRGRPDALFLPGHGAAVEDPAARLEALQLHRSARRAGVEAALGSGPRTIAQIREIVYEPLAPGLRPGAERNVFAHLLELIEAGRVEAVGALSVSGFFRAARA